MAFKYSLAQLTCLNATPVELAQLAADCGYDSVSIRQIYMGLPNENRYEMIHDKKMLADFKAVMKNTGISVADVELARVLENTDLDAYEPVFALTAELGCQDILGSVWVEPNAAAVETLQKMADLAKKYNLYLNMEYVPVAGIKDLTSMVKYIEAVGKDNVKLMVDMHHFYRANDSLEELANIPSHMFRMAHLCDVPNKPVPDYDEMVRIMREDRAYVGEGLVDIKAILNAMPICTYSIELPNVAEVEKYDYKGHAQRCLDTCKAYVETYVTGRQ